MTDAPATVRIPARFLEATGKALYGPEWQSPLSRALGHNSPRTVQRWAAAAKADDVYQISRSLLEELLGLLEIKVPEVTRTWDALKTFYDALP